MELAFRSRESEGNIIAPKILLHSDTSWYGMIIYLLKNIFPKAWQGLPETGSTW
jgi:hypothetical protein